MPVALAWWPEGPIEGATPLQEMPVRVRPVRAYLGCWGHGAVPIWGVGAMPMCDAIKQAYIPVEVHGTLLRVMPEPPTVL